MKRKIALILAGCLAFSPVSAGLSPAQAYAAETDTISEVPEQTPIVITVKDENDVTLTESGEENAAEKYTVKVGETRQLTAIIEQGTDSPVLSEWSSETPDIISIDDEGMITAQSAGVCKISLSISGDAAQEPLIIEYEIVVESKPEEASIESTAVESVNNADSVETVEKTEEKNDAARDETAAETAQAEEIDVIVDVAESADNTAEITDEPAEIADETAEIANETAEISGDKAEVTEDTEKAAATDETIVSAANAAPAKEAEAADQLTSAEQAEESAQPESEIEAAEEAAAATADPAATTQVADPTAATTDPAAAAQVADPAAATADPTAANDPATAAAADPNAELTGVISVDAATVTANADAKVTSQQGAAVVVKPHWEGSGTNWSYIQSDGSKATGLLTLGSRTFCLSSAGNLRYGWIRIGSNYYYADSEGALVTGWLRRAGNKYYFRSNHTMVTGKVKIGDNTYIFKQDGAMKTGWCSYGGKLYYLGSDGVMRTGWQTISGNRYLFLSTGVMKTGWFSIGVRKYYLAKTGRQVTGFLKSGGTTYYLRQDGYATKGWKKIGSYWFYFVDSKMKTGWLELSSGKYYLDGNGRMVTGTRTIDGVQYHFESDGALTVNRYTYSNTEEFINCIAPLVKKYAPAWGVKVYSPIIAQAILESGHGESSLGKIYHNYFGLKCGTLWTGKSVNLRTGEEYTPGTYTTISANFRVYDNMEEGVEGYFIFLFKNRTRYDNLIGETDPYDYLVKIKEDGYATSSRYVQNVYNVIKSYNLTRFDD